MSEESSAVEGKVQEQTVGAPKAKASFVERRWSAARLFGICSEREYLSAVE